MERLRQALHRLGWPVESLSNEQIARELHRRWFGCNADVPDQEHAVSNATANGIFASMAREGNLDALCWPEGDDSALPDYVAIPELHGIEEGPEWDRAAAETFHPDRRRAHREPASDVIDSVVPSSSDGSSGWPVGVSTGGIAFVTETRGAPAGRIDDNRKHGRETVSSQCRVVPRYPRVRRSVPYNKLACRVRFNVNGPENVAIRSTRPADFRIVSQALVRTRFGFYPMKFSIGSLR